MSFVLQYYTTKVDLFKIYDNSLGSRLTDVKQNVIWSLVDFVQEIHFEHFHLGKIEKFMSLACLKLCNTQILFNVQKIIFFALKFNLFMINI